MRPSPFGKGEPQHSNPNPQQQVYISQPDDFPQNLPTTPPSPRTEVKYLHSAPSVLRPCNDAWVPVVNDRPDGLMCLYRTTKFLHRTNLGGVFQGTRLAAPEMIHFSVLNMEDGSPLPPSEIQTSPWTTTHFLTGCEHEDKIHDQSPSFVAPLSGKEKEIPGSDVNFYKLALPGLFIAPINEIHRRNHSYKIQLVCQLPDQDSINTVSITVGSNSNFAKFPSTGCIVESSHDCSSWTSQLVLSQLSEIPSTIVLNEPVRDAKYWRFTLSNCDALSFGMLSFNQDVAIKKSARVVNSSPDVCHQGDNPNREALIQRLAQSIFTTRLIDVHDDVRFDPNHHWIVSQFYHNRDLYTTLNQGRSNEGLTMIHRDVVGVMFAQLVLAMYYLHHHLNIVHLDLKPSNILLDDFGNLILTDFGVARRIFPHTTQYNIYTNGDIFNEELLFRSQPFIPQFVTDPALSYAQGGLAMLQLTSQSPHEVTERNVVQIHPIVGMVGTKDYMCPNLIKQHVDHKTQVEKYANRNGTCLVNSCPHPPYDGVHCRFHHAQQFGYDPRLSDVFSMGVILFTMLFKVPPFVGYAKPQNRHWEFICTRGTERLARSFAVQYNTIYSNCDDQAFHLMDRMLSADVTTRPYLSDIIRHPYTAKYLHFYLQIRLLSPFPIPKIVSTVIPPQFYHRHRLFPIGQRILLQTSGSSPRNIDVIRSLRNMRGKYVPTSTAPTFGHSTSPHDQQEDKMYENLANDDLTESEIIFCLDDLYPITWATLGDSYYATIPQIPMIHYKQFNTPKYGPIQLDLTNDHNVRRCDLTFRLLMQHHDGAFQLSTRVVSPHCEVVLTPSAVPSYNGVPIFSPPTPSTQPSLTTRFLLASRVPTLQSTLSHPSFQEGWDPTQSPWSTFQSANYPQQLFRFIYPSISAPVPSLLAHAGSATRPSVVNTLRPSFHIAPLAPSQCSLFLKGPFSSQAKKSSTSHDWEGLQYFLHHPSRQMTAPYASSFSAHPLQPQFHQRNSSKYDQYQHTHYPLTIHKPSPHSPGPQYHDQWIRLELLAKISEFCLYNNFNWGRYHRRVCMDFVDILTSAGRFHFGFKTFQVNNVETPVISIRGTLNISHHSSTFENPTYWSTVNERVATLRLHASDQHLADEREQYSQIAMRSETGHVCSGGLANAIPCHCCPLSFFSDCNSAVAAASGITGSPSLIIGNPQSHVKYHWEHYLQQQAKHGKSGKPFTKDPAVYHFPSMSSTSDTTTALPIILPAPHASSKTTSQLWNQHFLINPPFPSKLSHLENDPIQSYKPNLPVDSIVFGEQSLRYLQSLPSPTVLLSPYFYRGLTLTFDHNLTHLGVVPGFHPTFAALMEFKSLSPHVIHPNISKRHNLPQRHDNPTPEHKPVAVSPANFPSLFIAPTFGNPTVTVQQTIAKFLAVSKSKHPHSVHTPRFLAPHEIPAKYPELFSITTTQDPHQEQHRHYSQQQQQHQHQQQHQQQQSYYQLYHQPQTLPPTPPQFEEDNFVPPTDSRLATFIPSRSGNDIFSSFSAPQPTCSAHQFIDTGMGDIPTVSTQIAPVEGFQDRDPFQYQQPHQHGHSPHQHSRPKSSYLHRLPALPTHFPPHNGYDSHLPRPAPGIALLSQRHSFQRAVAHLPEILNSGIYEHYRRNDGSEVLEYGIPIEILISQSYPEVPPVLALLPINGFAINFHHPWIFPYTTQHGEQVGIIMHPLLSKIAENWAPTDCNMICGLLHEIIQDLQIYFSHDLPPYIPYDRPLLASMMNLAQLADPFRYFTNTSKGGSGDEQSQLSQSQQSQQQQQQSQQQQHQATSLTHPRWDAVCQWVNHIMIQQLPYHYDIYPPEYDEHFTNYTRPRAILSTPINTIPYPSSNPQQS